MTDTIYTDAMIDACAHACHEAHRAAGPPAATLPLNDPWDVTPEDWREVRRQDACEALSEDGGPCDLCRSVTLAVAKHMGWPRA